ncbi:MAG: HupE/UreJ family protein [Candidatus Binatia bacterium]
MSRRHRALALLLLAAPAAAHERTVSFSTIEVDGERARVSVRLTPLDISRLPWATTAGADLDRQLGAYLADTLTLQADGGPCTLTAPPRRGAGDAEHVRFTWDLRCPSPRGLRLHSGVLLDVAPSHLHFARVHLPGAPPRERVLSEAEPDWSFDPGGGAPVGDSLLDYLVLGVEHILTGYDHLVFLLGLLLLGGTLLDVVRIVTGFTVAHSITLGLAVFGVVQPARAPIEALIGLSIALVASENLWLEGGRRPLIRWALAAALLALAAGAAAGHGVVPALTLVGLALFATCYLALVERVARPAPLRAAVAFVFGLVHGFGFAGVLMEAELPSGRLAPALFGFNLGVELGQVAAVLALWPLLRLLARVDGGRWHRAVIDYGSAAILAVGVFWFVTRSYG